MLNNAQKHRQSRHSLFKLISLICFLFGLCITHTGYSKERLVDSHSKNSITNINNFINNVQKNVNKYFYGIETLQKEDQNWNTKAPADCYSILACCYTLKNNDFSNSNFTKKENSFKINRADIITFNENENAELPDDTLTNYLLVLKDSVSAYIKVKKYQEAIRLLKDMEALLSPEVDIDGNLKIFVYDKLAAMYRLSNDMAMSIIYQKKKIESMPEEDANQQKDLAINYYRLASLQQKISKDRDAIESFLNAEKYFVEAQYPKYLPTIFQQLARSYRDIGEYERSLDYFNKNLVFYLNYSPSSIDKIANTHKDIGLVYFKQKKYNSALDEFYNCLDYEKVMPAWYALSINELRAVCFKEIGDLDNATNTYNDVIKRIENYFAEEPREIAKSYMNYAALLIDIGQRDKGAEYLKRALDINKRVLSPDDPLLAKNYINLAEYYSSTNPDLSLESYHRAVMVFATNHEAGFYDMPSLNRSISPLDLIKALKGKAEAFYHLFFLTDGKKEELKASLLNFDEALNLIDRVRFDLVDEESKLFLSANEKESYSSAIQISNILYGFERDDKYAQKAFEYAERSKAVGLLAAIRNVGARKVGGIPEDLQKQEIELQEAINIKSKAVFEAEKNHFPENKVDSLKSVLLDQRKDYEKLIKFYEDSFPEYFKLKYNAAVISPDELRNKLSDDEVFVEYVIGDNRLNIFALSKDKYRFITNQVDSSFFKDIEVIINSLSKNNFAHIDRSVFDTYAKAANSLYKLLIEPLELEFEFKKLIITPDDYLAYIPFEALIRTFGAKERFDFRTLDYLIRYYDIDYAFSGTLLYEQKLHHYLHHPKILGFAAGYENFDELSDEKQSIIKPYRKNLPPLHKVKDEVMGIQQVANADAYVDTAATEDNFIRQYQNYDILHLAMHTIIENDDPMFSKLAFSQSNTSKEDGFLYAYQIYNMDLSNTRLAVLSACNTGDGKLRKGEGVMSFARSFFYAGCPSVVMTLWPVEDLAGSGLMIDFYQNLDQGMEIGAALRAAKLNYLKQADPLRAHPFFWAGFVCIGQNQKLYVNQSNLALYTGGGIFILAIAVFFLIRRRREYRF